MKKVIIMGAGPAGLSAGIRLQEKGISTSLFEKETQVGGISKTIAYKDNYFDLGGHRFFTKIKEVQQLWEDILKENFRKTPRLSRIYYKNNFFDYPLSPINALTGVGIIDTLGILSSYLKSKIIPYKDEENFEQWVSNRFGKKLFLIFFKTYTEKVWGIPCSDIQAEWAAQRIKGLSLTKAIVNALFKPNSAKIKTLINEFHYPVYGPGMMYNEMKNRVELAGGTVNLNIEITGIYHENGRVTMIEAKDERGNVQRISGTNFISTIPINQLIEILSPAVPEDVLDAARGLSYRSMLTVDVIINKESLFPDNWIYVHSPEVKLGRIQNFKNWSSEMVSDPSKTTLGLEYFCNEGDEFWNTDDESLYRLAASELEKIRICNSDLIEDYTVVRVPKAYPVYNKGYRQKLQVIEVYLKKFSNLELAGRYGLFRYNNMDHSILTGLYSAANIIEGRRIYDNFTVNTEQEYHEENTKKRGGDHI